MALHMAHSGILAAESASGVAGGVNVMLIPQASCGAGLLRGLQQLYLRVLHAVLLQLKQQHISSSNLPVPSSADYLSHLPASSAVSCWPLPDV